MTGPTGNSEFCFPLALPRKTLRVSGKQILLFPLGPIISAYCIVMIRSVLHYHQFNLD